LNFSRIIDTPHTTEQISAIWTAYHTAHTGGGYVCATVPLAAYERMTDVAMRYPYFVLPVSRPSADTTSTENSTACEFYVMQWAFYDPPPVPSALDVELAGLKGVEDGSRNPRTSTVLFAPLHEYKQRDTFTTPHLVLTHYTDLARTHGVVLLRGEITPSNDNDTAKARYLMSQQDAQMLAMGVQRFYLWGQGTNVGSESEEERLLKTFHEKPEQFDWKELLKYSMQI
jgi:ATP synthase F1 complex assembly factor 1